MFDFSWKEIELTTPTQRIEAWQKESEQRRKYRIKQTKGDVMISCTLIQHNGEYGNRKTIHFGSTIDEAITNALDMFESGW